MDEAYKWRTKTHGVFDIGGKKINLMPKGYEYARQFGRISSWLGTYGLSAFMYADEEGALDDSGDQLGQISKLISVIFEHGMTPDAMIELGIALTGEDEDFIAENFDPGWLVDGILLIFDEREGVRLAFQRLWERFFLAAEPDSEDKKDQTQD